MELYIIRHGAAAELDSEIAEEGYRYLTIHGRNHCKIVAQRLKDMKVSFDVIFSSPLVRAVQTAEIFASVLKYDHDIKTAIELVSGNSFNRFLQLIKRNSHHNSVGIFAHAPDVNTITLNLIKSTDVKDLKINFKNVSVCKIEYDIEKDIGRFIWFLNSENMKLTEA
ncbi:MAG: phosphohistidine phosphatase SixA [Chlorobi bacterium]|nr:phosphohistidine phosphatase SixA [Chlorobiota bacterium]MCI0716452.1 phosphohistidine phosphatase SixA [Chlorobiota bacterium]